MQASSVAFKHKNTILTLDIQTGSKTVADEATNRLIFLNTDIITKLEDCEIATERIETEQKRQFSTLVEIINKMPAELSAVRNAIEQDFNFRIKQDKLPPSEAAATELELANLYSRLIVRTTEQPALNNETIMETTINNDTVALNEIRAIQSKYQSLLEKMDEMKVISRRQLHGLREAIHSTDEIIRWSERMNVTATSAVSEDNEVIYNNMDSDYEMINDKSTINYALSIFHLDLDTNIKRFLQMLWHIARFVDVNDVFKFIDNDINTINRGDNHKHLSLDYIRLLTEAQHVPPYRQRRNISKYLRSILYNTTHNYMRGLVNETDFMASNRKHSILIYNDETIKDLRNYSELLDDVNYTTDRSQDNNMSLD